MVLGITPNTKFVYSLTITVKCNGVSKKFKVTVK